jgi:hypothetical protein
MTVTKFNAIVHHAKKEEKEPPQRELGPRAWQRQTQKQKLWLVKRVSLAGLTTLYGLRRARLSHAQSLIEKVMSPKGRDRHFVARG